MKDYELKPSQQKIVDFIVKHKRCNIFSGCGTGKTLATLEALTQAPKPILIVAPLRVAQHEWQEQAERFNIPLTFAKLTGVRERKRIEALKTKADVYIINFELLAWLKKALHNKYYLDDKPFFATVVVDEATLIKNHQVYNKAGRRGIALYSRGNGNATALVSKANHVSWWINLTATPLHNNLLDLWGLQFPIDFGKSLGASRSAFHASFFKARQFKSHMPPVYEPLPGSREKILARMRPTTYIAPKQTDLNKTILKEVEVELPPEIQKLYKSVERERAMVIGDDNYVTDTAAGMKRRQIASGFVLDHDSTSHDIHKFKLEALQNLLKTLDGNIIIVYQFTAEAEKIKEILPEARMLSDDTAQTLKDWNDGKIKYLLIHPKSAGHGINLQSGGNTMIMYSPDWNGELYAQTIERIGASRQRLSGFNRDVLVYHIIIKGTIEERVMATLKKKLKNSI